MKEADRGKHPKDNNINKAEKIRKNPTDME
jgi:hypothetical protein